MLTTFKAAYIAGVHLSQRKMNVNNHSILREVINGTEFFTVKETGESGMSYSGLAVMCGLGQPAITKLVKTLVLKNENEILESLLDKDSNPIPRKAPKRLERWIGKDLHLLHQYSKKGGSVKILRADFCAAVIKHYAFEGSESAENALDAISDIGMTSYIQGVTKWLPGEHQSSLKSRESLNRILDNPRPWTLTFDSDFEDRLSKISGLHKNDIRNGKLYWEFIYNWLTPEEKRKLDEVNPVQSNGRRKYAVHQMLDESTKIRLSPHIQAVYILMKSSSCLYDLRRLMDRQLGRVEQLGLFDSYAA